MTTGTHRHPTYHVVHEPSVRDVLEHFDKDTIDILRCEILCLKVRIAAIGILFASKLHRNTKLTEKAIHARLVGSVDHIANMLLGASSLNIDDSVTETVLRSP